MTAYQQLQQELRATPRSWLVTGVAGFIGSHLLETLLQLGQRVIGLDDFSTGSPANLSEVRGRVGAETWTRFLFLKGSIVDLSQCQGACDGVDYVLHQAGFVSVPLSIENPLACHETNVTGTLNLLISARDQGVRRLVFASSSSVYGDDTRLPNVEQQIGQPFSPYGASKLMGEINARLFRDRYGLESISLRYFNVFGPRQNPTGGYAAVVPQWITQLVRGEAGRVHGDGSITRDFCPVENVVQANLLAATTLQREAVGEAFNVALGARTRLDELYALIATRVAALVEKPALPAQSGPVRPGDIPHSGADIAKIQRLLGYVPEVTVDAGLDETVRWYFAAAPR